MEYRARLFIFLKARVKNGNHQILFLATEINLLEFFFIGEIFFFLFSFSPKYSCIKLHLNTCLFPHFSSAWLSFPHFHFFCLFKKKWKQKNLSQNFPLFGARTTFQVERCMQSGGCRRTKHEKTTSGSHIFLNFQMWESERGKKERKLFLHGKWPVLELHEVGAFRAFHRW